MEFYTNVSRYGNNILFRGVGDGGKRIKKRIKYRPRIFVEARDEESAVYKSIYGDPLDSLRFDTMRDCSDYIRRYKDIESYKIFGNTKYIPAFIQDTYPSKIEYDRSLVRVFNFDIEVLCTEGFPDPRFAEWPITTIALRDSYDKNVVHLWGQKGYDPDQSEHNFEIVYHQYVDEATMLRNFVEYWQDNYPDIVTGWNAHLFDITYIVTRINKLLGEDIVKLLSPWYNISAREIKFNGRDNLSYDIQGISIIDYMDIFKKFTAHSLGAQESYRLDHIAHVVLGENKLSYEEYSSLSELYEHDHQKYCEYNIKDVLLVERIDDKLNLMSLVLQLAYMSGVNYTDTLGTIAMWDSIIYRELISKNMAPPMERGSIAQQFPGGYVKDVIPGMYEWVSSFDLNSLYPNIIIQWNMSPETIYSNPKMIDPNDVIDSGKYSLTESDLCVAANGVTFRNDKIGIIPSLIRDTYDQRVTIKSEMLALAKENETKKSASISKRIEILKINQLALKILMNSLYGAMGSPYFRYFDVRMAAAVTTTGQMVIKLSEKVINDYLTKILDKDKDRVVMVDTDSNYVTLADVVDKFKPKHPLKFIEQFCEKGIEPQLENAYINLSNILGCKSNEMVMKLENIGDKMVVRAAKNYIMNVLVSEGIHYTEPKLKIMGIEAVKSSTPMVCRDDLKKLFKLIMNSDERKCQEFISGVRKRFREYSPEEIAFPRSVNKLDSYSFNSKSLPIQVFGSLIYNKRLKDLGIDTKYEKIVSGEKIKFVYLKRPNNIELNPHVICFMNVLPREFQLTDYIDYDTQFQKAFIAPIESIFRAINWSIEEQNTLEDFFG